MSMASESKTPGAGDAEGSGIALLERALEKLKPLSESSDAYPHLVAILNSSWRVIECRNGIQWVLQRRAGQRHGTARWDGKSYFRTKEALIRVCRASAGEIEPSACTILAALPERFCERDRLGAEARL